MVKVLFHVLRSSNRKARTFKSCWLVGERPRSHESRAADDVRQTTKGNVMSTTLLTIIAVSSLVPFALAVFAAVATDGDPDSGWVMAAFFLILVGVMMVMLTSNEISQRKAQLPNLASGLCRSPGALYLSWQVKPDDVKRIQDQLNKRTKCNVTINQAKKPAAFPN